MTHLSIDNIKTLEAELRLQQANALKTIWQRLHQGGAGAFGLSADSADTRELANADLLADIDIAQLRLELADLHRLDEALARIEAGTYGVCSHCGRQIALPRLRAQPAASTCLACQETFEHNRQEPLAP